MPQSQEPESPMRRAIQKYVNQHEKSFRHSPERKSLTLGAENDLMEKLEAESMTDEQRERIQKHILYAKSIARVKEQSINLKQKAKPGSYNQVKSKVNQKLKTRNYRSPFRDPSPRKSVSTI